MTSRWLIRARPRVAPRIRLVCFPYAGSGASVYVRWSDVLPADVEVWGVQLPGREGRLREPLGFTLPQLADEIAAALHAALDGPFAFFGHSMGAPLAYETALRLAQGGLRAERLFVSGRRPPHVPDPDTPLRHLSDADFVSEIVRRYGGIPAEILNDAEILALLLPALRADIAALEQHVTEAPRRVSIPVTAFGGSDDRRTPPAHLEAWRDTTTSSFSVHAFPGGHFYLTEQRAALLAAITRALANAPLPADGGVPA